MSNIQQLREAVKKLYLEKRVGRADWADWIYENHVLLVGDEARKIAIRYGGNPDLAEAAGLLHDIADAVMKREDPRHEGESLRIAQELLRDAGYGKNEIAIITSDAITKHGCHGDTRPSTPEGKAMATADGIVHLTSDFYRFAEEGRLNIGTPVEVADWALPKLDRDFLNKIAYDDLRNEVRPTYERLKAHFNNLKAI